MSSSTPDGQPPQGGRPVRLDEALAALAMALICAISLANVVVRYLTDVSFAFTEEFSVFLLVFMTLVGSAVAFATDGHIRIVFFRNLLSKPRRKTKVRVEIGFVCNTGVQQCCRHRIGA